MKRNRAASLLHLFDETSALFHQLRAIAAKVHGQGQMSAGRRGVLRSLDRGGPQSVPQLARARPVSRQHIQVIVNGLLEQGLVAVEPNPAHRRSPLLHLTQRGRRQLHLIQKREWHLLAHVNFGLSTEQINNVASVLHSIRRVFEGQKWRTHVAGNH